MTDSFTFPMLANWLLTAQKSLRSARAEIDALNVFPVPDGDTGTNLYLTWEAACQTIRTREDVFGGFNASDSGDDFEFEAAAQEIGRHAILGARGNSGVIMSALLRDLCLSVAREPHAFAQALRAGTVGAYSAVATPVEGTILTVARACADQAEEVASRGGALVEVASGAAEAAYHALLRTPDLLEQLRTAGVVDAGGRGLVVVLDSLVASLTGVRPKREFPISPPALLLPPYSKHVDSRGTAPDFEVMYHLKSGSIEGLHETLNSLGNSVMIAGVDGMWNVHAHVSATHISDSLNAGIDLGEISQISVTPLSSDRPLVHGKAFVEQDFAETRAPGLHSSDPTGTRYRRLVAVTHGSGIHKLLTEQGVTCVPTPARQQPSAHELITAGKIGGPTEVIILPSDRDAHAVADIAALELKSLGIRSGVVPTKSVTQTLAAIAVHSLDEDFDRDIVNMTRAASSTHYGAVTRATRNVLTMVGECQQDDFLGLIDGDISIIGQDLGAVSIGVLEKMLAPGAGLVTVVRGQDDSPVIRDQIQQWITKHHPLLDVDFVDGEQPLWPFIFGVE